MAALEYVEIRSGSTRELLGLIDNAKSIIWSPSYYGAGFVEIYAPCSAGFIDILQAGNLITRADEPNVGIIERVEIVYNSIDGRMILASGRFLKSILDRRLIYRMSGNSVSATVLRGNVETAARQLVQDNAISCAFDSERNIPDLVLGAHSGSTEKIIDNTGAVAEKQVTYKGLLEYTDELLEEYALGSRISLSPNRKMQYIVYKGVDRSVDNVDGNEPVIFSQDFDNLISSDYAYSVESLKNTALIGGEGEGLARFCVLLKSTNAGLERREVFVDAAQSSRTYKDETDSEITLSDAEYAQQLATLGKQEVALRSIVESFSGAIDITKSMVQYGYGKSVYLGDIATIQDVDIGLYINARILTVTERMDDEGYNVEVEFGL